VAAATVPGVKVADVRTAVIAAVPLQAAQIVSALSRAKLTSSRGSIPRSVSRANKATAAGSEDRAVL